MKATKSDRAEEFPKTITDRSFPGIAAKIYRSQQRKKDKDGEEKVYQFFAVSYTLLGKRKIEAYADLGKADAAARAAIIKIANGEQAALELRNGDAYIYTRAKGHLEGTGLALDTACQIIADCLKALGGKGTPIEACRDYAKRHGKIAAKITILAAAKEMIEQEEREQDGKRKVAWVKLLKTHVQNKFACDFNKHVHEIEPSDLNTWLAKLDCAERTKKNIRDTLKHFFKWCRGRGYLPKDSDLLADVQDYRKRKRGKIEILSPDELRKLLAKATDDLLPYVALRAFAGLRDSEARAIDWQNIDLAGGWIEITEEVAKASDDENGTRRLIPVKDCLKAWLKDRSKESGRVCRFDNTSKQISALCEASGVAWKRNCLRHSYVSYAIAESNDIPAVATHSGNSPAVIRQHYLRVVKPDAAKAWFSVLPTP